MTATNPRDAETVRSLLRQHVPSGFPTELGPLTVGDVACRIKSDMAIGRDDIRLSPADVAVNTNLLADPTPVAGRMTPRTVNEIRQAGGLLDGSDHYWEQFRRAAITMLMARSPGPAVVFACERSE
jgi:hypothetical protein